MICSGGLVVFPTTSLYGLGADAANMTAVEQIFVIKQRPSDKPILVLVPNIQHLKRMVRRIPKAAERVMEAFWPGNITLVFEADPAVSPVLTGGTGKIGIRFPVYPVAQLLVHEADRPVTATSANISGYTGCSKIEDLDAVVADSVDLILNAGHLKGGTGSTVLDITEDPPVLLREGLITRSRLCSVLPSMKH